MASKRSEVPLEVDRYLSSESLGAAGCVGSAQGSMEASGSQLLVIFHLHPVQAGFFRNPTWNCVLGIVMRGYQNMILI